MLLAALFSVGGQAYAGGDMRGAPTAPSAAVIRALDESASTEPAATTSAPETSQAVTATPQPTANPESVYFSVTEQVVSSTANGHWQYKSPTLYVDIKKVRIKAKDVTYFIADIRLKDPKSIRSGLINGKKVPEAIARQFSAVYAQNGDFCTMEKNLKGIMIRGGKVLSERRGADTMAFLPDGTLKIFKPGETTAKKLLAMGIKDSWSFGPALIKNGVLRTNYSGQINCGKNPRSGFGMIEKGHYVGIVVGGRNPGYSVGMTYPDFAKLFQTYGCKQAYCFDGGASASMVFMGKAMDTRVLMMGTHKVTMRRVPDIFIIGKSAKVPK
jgi:exopolysaccharide biosynthesis protein